MYNVYKAQVFLWQVLLCTRSYFSCFSKSMPPFCTSCFTRLLPYITHVVVPSIMIDYQSSVVQLTIACFLFSDLSTCGTPLALWLSDPMCCLIDISGGKASQLARLQAIATQVCRVAEQFLCNIFVCLTIFCCFSLLCHLHSVSLLVLFIYT